MSDNGSGTPLRNVDKTIEEALKVWEKFGFKDVSLWETFQYDFESFTEEDFKSASIHHQRKLRDYLRKYGVWVRKQQRYTIARSLHEVLLEEEPTPWTEAEIIACEEKEEFASYQISRLIDSDFGRKPRKSRALTPTSPTGPPPAATSPTPGPSTAAPVNTPIYSTQPSATEPTPAVYTTPGAYIQPPGTGPTPGAYMQPTGPTSAAYTQPSGIGATPAAYATAGGHTQPSSTGPAHAVQNHTFAINPPSATSTSHGRELSNLAKMYTEEAKYSGRNDSFTFKLAIFHDICSRADVPREAKMKAFPTMLKGLALDYYYSNISTSTVAMNFDQVCNSIWNYFEGAEYKQSVLSKWNELTLKSVISKSEGKPIEECLEKFIDELRHLQHGLDPELRTDSFIYNKLINACQNLPACQYACFKPADSLASLINDFLHTSKSHKRSLFHGPTILQVR